MLHNGLAIAWSEMQGANDLGCFESVFGKGFWVS